MLPFGPESLAWIPWSWLLASFSLGLAAYAGWLLWRYRERQDLYYTLLGLYLLGLQLPLLIPPLGQALGVTCPLGPDLPSRFLKILPVAALFVLAWRTEKRAGT